MTRLATRVALLCALVPAACDKNADQDIAGPVPAGARIKFFNFGVGAPGVNFYANDTKITAISSASDQEATAGVAYGGAGAGGYYSALPAGSYTLTGRIAATTDKNLAISTLTTTLALDKAYSFYQSGFYDAVAKTVDAFIVEDDFPPEFDYSVAYVRFVHAIANANPLTLYAVNTATNDTVAVGGEVSYKGAGTFTALPEGVYNLGARYTGVATNAIGRTGVQFLAGRVYTIGARGDITVTSTTSANRPILDNTPNR